MVTSGSPEKIEGAILEAIEPYRSKMMFETLANNNINIQVISTSEIKISVLISSDYSELAVRTLHDVFGLDKV